MTYAYGTPPEGPEPHVAGEGENATACICDLDADHPAVVESPTSP